jgi:hypothetical protein
MGLTEAAQKFGRCDRPSMEVAQTSCTGQKSHGCGTIGTGYADDGTRPAGIGCKRHKCYKWITTPDDDQTKTDCCIGRKKDPEVCGAYCPSNDLCTDFLKTQCDSPESTITSQQALNIRDYCVSHYNLDEIKQDIDICLSKPAFYAVLTGDKNSDMANTCSKVFYQISLTDDSKYVGYKPTLTSLINDFCQNNPSDSRCGCFLGKDYNNAKKVYDSLPDASKTLITSEYCINPKCSPGDTNKFFDNFFYPEKNTKCPQNVKICNQIAELGDTNIAGSSVIKQTCEGYDIDPDTPPSEPDTPPSDPDTPPDAPDTPQPKINRTYLWILLIILILVLIVLFLF